MSNEPTPEESSAVPVVKDSLTPDHVVDATKMVQSKTPRTDEIDLTFHDDYGWLPKQAAEGIDADFKELETELAEANNEIDRLSSNELEPSHGISRALAGREAVGDHPLALEVQQVVRERDQLREKVERLTDALIGAKKDLFALGVSLNNYRMEQINEALESTKPSAGGEG